MSGMGWDGGGIVWDEMGIIAETERDGMGCDGEEMGTDEMNQLYFQSILSPKVDGALKGVTD